jgi:hypothetical protein
MHPFWVWLALVVVLLGLTAMGWKRAYGVVGKRLYLLPCVTVPWIVELVPAFSRPGGRMHGGPAWVDEAIMIGALANPVLWIVALLVLWRAWRCAVPFVGANLLVAPFATIAAGCGWAGACF